jgi:hypothetical protein
VRPKAHADTAIVATIEIQMIHKRPAVCLPKHKKRVRHQPNSLEFLKIIF